MRGKLIICFMLILGVAEAQDLSQGLLINDLSPHPMEDIDKPAYLESYIDPSFGTQIRRITDAELSSGIVPMYSTIQAWNTDETYMILYDLSNSTHMLLNGQDYTFIRYLDDISPDDLENIFWDFNNPEVFYYLNNQNNEFISYNVPEETNTVLVELNDYLTECAGSLSMGNDVQMMSWDSDIFTFRCGNEQAFYFKLSDLTLVEFNIAELNYVAPVPAPSGDRFFHRNKVYDLEGNLIPEINLNIDASEHSCLGKLSNGHDGYFAIAFEEGPQGGCQGDIIGHDLTTGDCFPITGTDIGYAYPQSGTHISALSHQNTEGGWLAASFMGFDLDGQVLLDQELVIAKADPENPIVCRIGHHRSDEQDFDYWGEPHAVISPSGTRVLFASDWSGTEDGQSIDCYVVELPVYLEVDSVEEDVELRYGIQIAPNPASSRFEIINPENYSLKDIQITDPFGTILIQQKNYKEPMDVTFLSPGLYFVRFLVNNVIQTHPLIVE